MEELIKNDPKVKEKLVKFLERNKAGSFYVSSLKRSFYISRPTLNKMRDNSNKKFAKDQYLIEMGNVTKNLKQNVVIIDKTLTEQKGLIKEMNKNMEKTNKKMGFVMDKLGLLLKTKGIKFYFKNIFIFCFLTFLIYQIVNNFGLLLFYGL